MWQGTFLPESASSVDYLTVPYSPSVQSHASTSVRTLKIPNTGSHTIVWTQENTAHRQEWVAPLLQLLCLKPVLNWANVCSPNILRTLRRTMIRFLIELLVRRIWFGQSKLYFVLNWLVMRCKLRPELAADAQQTA